MSRLETEQLTLGYNEEAIIEGLDLCIPGGQITALVGPNGCGKSTLLKGLARLLRPRGGCVYLDSVPIPKTPTRELAKRLGILPQGPMAPEGLTVRELVAQGRYPHQRWFQQWTEQDARATAHALTITGMQELADCPVDALSGGQRQRAWIAMALAQEAETMLLDEPTTYLDIAHQIEVLDLLYEVNRSEGRTIVMVLHDLNHACRYGDHLIVLTRGEVYAQGAPHTVITEDAVREVFGIGCRIITDPVAGTPLCIPIGTKRAGMRQPLAGLHTTAYTDRNLREL